MNQQTEGSATRATDVIRDRIKEFRRVPASQLIPNQKNWRKHPAEQRAALRGILNEIGFVGACLARELPDGSLELLDGHLRTETAGDSEVPVLIVDLDDAEAAKVLATLDPIAAMAEADAELLGSLMTDFETQDEAVRKMLDDLAADSGIKPDPVEIVEDEAPEPPAVPVTKPGDLWILGDHRLLCGDSTKAEDVQRLMGGERAGLLFTSPPYGQQRDYGVAKDQVTDWDKLMRGVFSHAQEVLTADGQILVNLGLIHRDGEWIPYWDAWLEWMRSEKWKRFGFYVWDQGFGLPGNWNGRFAPSHEFVFHFNRIPIEPQKFVPKAPENVTERRRGGSTMRGHDGVCREFSSPEASAQPNKIPDSVIRVNRMHGGHGIDHPAIFPVALPSFAMNAFSGPVYEPFSGSGTTIVAGEQLGRRCFAMEIDPAYCDVTVARWEKLTGRKAELAK